VKPLSGHTKPFAVLGHPIGHTLSPIMHNAALESLGIDGIYMAFDVHPDRLMSVLPAMADMGFGGVNLTVPLKEVAFRGLSDLDESARRLRAVNTVQFLPSGMRGHNTDGNGFLRAIRESFGASTRGRCVFVLGCGGAGRAVAITTAVEGCERILLADVDAARCDAVAGDIRTFAPGIPVEVTGNDRNRWITAARSATLVIQASPLGMKPEDPPPLPPSAFGSGQWAFDLVYNLPETSFTRTAKQAGAQAVNGIGMLLHQGAEALTIWTGKPAPVAVMRQALEGALYKR
jgi:shikimate dehydrogenase